MLDKEDGTQDVIVVRTWKRDRSQNRMDLRSAIGNLMGNSGLSPYKIKELLLAGEVLETPLAAFQIDVLPSAIVPSKSVLYG